MPRGYRRIIAAVVVGLAIFAIGAGAERAALWADSPSAYPEYRETAEDAQKRFPSLSIPQALKAVKDQQPCRQPQGRDAADLCAEWRAANAAERASRWAWWQLTLSFFGVVGLGITLWFNFEAWRQAREAEADTDKALAAAQKSADAAERQVALTEKNAQRELRAYVHISGTQVSGVAPDGVVKATIVVTNYGKTPANKFRISCHLAAIFIKGEWAKDIPAGFFQDIDMSDPPMSDLGPGAPFQMTFELRDSMTPEFIEAFLKEGAAIVAGGKYFYADAFGFEREGQFRLWHDVKHGQGGNMTALKSGNHTT